LHENDFFYFNLQLWAAIRDEPRLPGSPPYIVHCVLLIVVIVLGKGMMMMMMMMDDDGDE
jgi:hypothetical protein